MLSPDFWLTDEPQPSKPEPQVERKPGTLVQADTVADARVAIDANQWVMVDDTTHRHYAHAMLQARQPYYATPEIGGWWVLSQRPLRAGVVGSYHYDGTAYYFVETDNAT